MLCKTNFINIKYKLPSKENNWEVQLTEWSITGVILLGLSGKYLQNSFSSLANISTSLPFYSSPQLVTSDIINFPENKTPF